MRNLLKDLRFALRQYRKSPGFVITAVLSLTLGISATTAIFSVIYGVLLDPYPYKDADRMVHVQMRGKNQTDFRGPLLFVNGTGYLELKEMSTVDDVFLQHEDQENLTGDQIPVTVNVGRFTPNLFDYMGVAPAIGREFTPADAPNGNPAPVAVLSYLFWQRQFGGSRDIVGKRLELDHRLYTVIGVVPPRFTWGDADVYLPATPTADPHDYWMSFVKLKPGAKFPVAESQFQTLINRYAKEDPNYPQERKAHIVTLNEEVLGRFSGTLILLFCAVIALLMIGCANVSILLLARGTARHHELAVRVSVGAARGRLIQQLLAESVLLSLTGAILGVIAAYRGVAALAAALPFYSFPHEAAIRVNLPVLGFSAGVGLLTGILFGISPAWRLSRPQLGDLIQASSSKHSGSAHDRNTHRLLIAGQVALTLLLMAAAGAAIKAFSAMIHTPLGFDPDHVLALDIGFPKGANPTWQARLNANELIRKTVTEVPGVNTAAVSTTWFPPFGGFTAKIELKSKPSLTDAQAMLGLISPQTFLVLRVPLLAGRLFDEAETMRAAHLAVVNQAFVKQFLGDADPLNQSVRSPMLKVERKELLSAGNPDDWVQIVGVVGDALNDGLDHPAKPAVFVPYSFILPPDEQLFVRVTGNPDSVERSIKERLQQLNPELVAGRDHSLSWWLETNGWGQERFIATLFSLFAFLALALAASGLYSVVSYAVTQRTQEVGIRMALGAPRASIVRLVLASTTVMLAVGITAGLILSVSLNGVITAWSKGSSGDPATLLFAATLLVLVAVAACVVPAWRAATIDPLVALRHE